MVGGSYSIGVVGTSGLPRPSNWAWGLGSTKVVPPGSDRRLPQGGGTKVGIMVHTKCMLRSNHEAFMFFRKLQIMPIPFVPTHFGSFVSGSRESRPSSVCR